jgi:hypothetical protein
LSQSRKAESKEIVKWVGTIYDEGRGKIKKERKRPRKHIEALVTISSVPSERC